LNSRVNPQLYHGLKSAELLFPELYRSERTALEISLHGVSSALYHNDRVLSIVTRNTWVAKTIVDLMIRMGLSRYLQVLWHPRTGAVIHGWLLDQDNAVATEAFELAPSINEEHLGLLDFNKKMSASLSKP
jgi:hypothetical protein